jgi:hypothetical protein
MLPFDTSVIRDSKCLLGELKAGDEFEFLPCKHHQEMFGKELKPLLQRKCIVVNRKSVEDTTHCDPTIMNSLISVLDMKTGTLLMKHPQLPVEKKRRLL